MKPIRIQNNEQEKGSYYGLCPPESYEARSRILFFEHDV
jgi:hypothetical protein